MAKHPEFQKHRLTPDGVAKSDQITELFDELMDGLVVLCPTSRAFSIARTKLEEAAMFARKAMAQGNAAAD